MSDQAITSTDPVVAQCNGGLFKGTLRMYPGRFELTARHLVFYQRSMWFQMFGLIGALLGRKSAGKRTLEIDLAKVREIARGKFGLNKKILDVTMIDGTPVRLSFDKYDDFTAELRAQLAKLAKLVDVGEERWQVVAA